MRFIKHAGCVTKRCGMRLQLYCDSKRAEIKAASPGADFKTLSTLLGAAWKSASDDEKAPFLAQNQVC